MNYEPKELAVVAADPQVTGARWSPCGGFLLAGGHDGRLRRWRWADGKGEELAPLAGHGGWVQPIAFAGERVVSGDSWGTLRAGDYQGEEPAVAWSVADAHDGWLRDLAVSPDGGSVASCGADGIVRLWSIEKGEKQRELAHSHDVRAVRWHPKGKLLAAGDDRGNVRLWDVASGRCERIFEASELYLVDRLQDVGGVWCLAFDPEGKTLVVGGTFPKNGGTTQGTPAAILYDVETGERRAALKLGAPNDCFLLDMAFHPDGFLMAVTCGTPGQGKLLFLRSEESEPFFTSTKMANCQSLSYHGASRLLAVVATNRGSNANGRPIDKDGNYKGNQSPIHVLELPG